MTRDDCKRIMENIEIIKHFAEGGDVERCFHDWSGKFIRWDKLRNSILLNGLGRYRIVKPHVVMRAGKMVALEHNPRPCELGRHDH